jgi:hypothetical protein
VGPSGSSPLRSYCSHDGQGREAGPGGRCPKILKGKLISSFRQPGDLLKPAEQQPKRRMQLTLSLRMLKRWDVEDGDDKVKTTVKPQIHVAVNEYWGTFCLHSVFIVRSDHQNFSHRAVGGWMWFSPDISLCGGGAGNRWSSRHYRRSSQDHKSQSEPCTLIQ